jgi:hypothetical protein
MNRLESRNWILLPYLLILGAALLRLTVSHPYDFIPISFGLLFFGAHQSKRELALPLFGLIGVVSELRIQPADLWYRQIRRNTHAGEAHAGYSLLNSKSFSGGESW